MDVQVPSLVLNKIKNVSWNIQMYSQVAHRPGYFGFNSS